MGNTQLHAFTDAPSRYYLPTFPACMWALFIKMYRYNLTIHTWSIWV